MTVGYRMTVTRPGDEWQAVCPALCHHGAVIYGDTRGDALTHIENAISLILEKMKLNGMLLPYNEPASGGVLLNIMIE